MTSRRLRTSSDDHELRDLVHEALTTATRAMDAITHHEAVCATRFGFIQDDLRLIKRIIAWAAAAIVGGMATIAWAYIKQSLHL